MINAVAVMVDLLCEMRSFEWVLWLRQEVEWSVEAEGLDLAWFSQKYTQGSKRTL